MRKSRLERNWERAGEMVQDLGSRVPGVADLLSSKGTAAVTAAATGIGAFAGGVRRMASPSRMRGLARSIEKSADYLRYRPASHMARDAWRAVNKKPVWIAAGSALGGWFAYRWLTRER